LLVRNKKAIIYFSFVTTFLDVTFFEISLTIPIFAKDRTYYRQFIHRASQTKLYFLNVSAKYVATFLEIINDVLRTVLKDSSQKNIDDFLLFHREL